MGKYFQVAIDGPVAAGKGTVSRLLAQRLGWLYVDTGAMYRLVALLAQRAGIPFADGRGIAKILRKAKIVMRNPKRAEMDGRMTTLLVDGEDVSWKIRAPEMSQASSLVAAHVQVRQVLVSLQQRMARSTSVVMEGRDIGSVVLPKAQLKIFLTATPEIRARRRQMQLVTRGENVPFQNVYDELVARDRRDVGRSLNPLKVVPEAWVFDTSELTIEQVVEKIVERIREIRGRRR